LQVFGLTVSDISAFNWLILTWFRFFAGIWGHWTYLGPLLTCWSDFWLDCECF
jgi:hypothetical protein